LVGDGGIGFGNLEEVGRDRDVSCLEIAPWSERECNGDVPLLDSGLDRMTALFLAPWADPKSACLTAMIGALSSAPDTTEIKVRENRKACLEFRHGLHTQH